MFTQQLRPGDSFLFPKGLIHFLYNMDSRGLALAVSGLSCRNPGAQIASTAIFTSKPYIPNEIVKKAFLINGHDIAIIRKNLGG
ncbi:hypothetical protein SLEP1_g32617 [Rubroshorea leprosula]|uniref:Germin-like protein n=1 Tax=Rubroshorea leprosula TaxID=152421 RepID=A0AAV5KE16_9ROSI|nr:hypothetical protein SLEP1_g32617 [Rubroshorea leprosula]